MSSLLTRLAASTSFAYRTRIFSRIELADSRRWHDDEFDATVRA